MEYIRFLGSGGQARIFLVQADGKLLACKESDNTRSLEKEAFFLKTAQNHCFVRFENYLQKNDKGYLFMEYVPGETIGKLMELGKLNEYDACMKILLRAAEGFSFLHSMKKPVLYRDIKPENLILTEGGEVKIIDFGCACYADEPRKNLAGTKGYSPNEQQNAGKEQGLFSDVYAFGKMMHYLFTGDNPYLPPAVKPDIRSYNRKFDRDLANLICACVNEEAEKRPPDMRYVRREMESIAAKKRKRYQIISGSRGIYQREFVYEKNILIR